MNSGARDRFLAEIAADAASGGLIRLVISKPADRGADIKKVVVVLVDIKKGRCLNFTYFHSRRTISKNQTVEAALATIAVLLERDFCNALLCTPDADHHFMRFGSGSTRIRKTAPSLKAGDGFGHDRVKRRIISSDKNIYLRELGVIGPDFRVRPEMANKYVQINRYVEILDPLIRKLDLPDEYQVVDMGCGKGYLTFALYDYLLALHGRRARLTGIEARPDLVETCRTVAAKAEFDRLCFLQGTIASVPLERIDILIALHACDTATDEAIARGIAAGSALIVCAPCCHKQLRRQFDLAGAHARLYRHGILKTRQAELVTDGLRAMIMELHGYKTDVFEFVNDEHTPKNIMITGVKRGQPGAAERTRLAADIAAVKSFYGIREHALERLLTETSAQE